MTLPKSLYLLENQQPFSQSLIWQLQRDYFGEAGIDAWRSGEVPHYITSNPVEGKTYAELVLAFLRDLSGQYCARQGGLALFPRHQQASLDLGCLLFLTDATTYRETIKAYERFVSDFGPDDYFSLKKLLEQHFATLTYRDIMGVLRLSGYDARIFRQMLPRLFELLPTITDTQRWNLFLAIPRIWDTYYPLGEEADLADDLGDQPFQGLVIILIFYR